MDTKDKACLCWKFRQYRKQLLALRWLGKEINFIIQGFPIVVSILEDSLLDIFGNVKFK